MCKSSIMTFKIRNEKVTISRMTDCTLILYNYKHVDNFDDCISWKSSDKLFKLVNNAMQDLYGLDVFDGYSRTTLLMAFKVIKYYSNQL